MSIWFVIVLVVGALYVLNRLTTTTDIPVSSILAEAREIVEQGHRRDQPTMGVGPKNIESSAKGFAGQRAA